MEQPMMCRFLIHAATRLRVSRSAAPVGAAERKYCASLHGAPDSHTPLLSPLDSLLSSACPGTSPSPRRLLHSAPSSAPNLSPTPPTNSPPPTSTPATASADPAPAYSPPSFPAILSLGLPSLLRQISDAGLFKHERVITSPQGPLVTVLPQQQHQEQEKAHRHPHPHPHPQWGDQKEHPPSPPTTTTPPPPHAQQQQEVLNFCANNYLGLSNHPRVVAAAHAALDSHGFGLSSVRFICGTQDLHCQLEDRLAAFHGTEAAVLFPSCFDANAGLFEALLGPDDAVVSDELNHASIIDGIRLCKAKRLRYRHSDMDDLETKLKEAQGARVRLIATDGVFSMQGDYALLEDICHLAQRYSALVFVDDCHATGLLGANGGGTPELFGVREQVHIVNSTLGKALGGGTGGYTAATWDICTMLRQKARPYLFSNSLAPAMAAAGLAALDLVAESNILRERLSTNTRLFRSRMEEMGFRVLPSFSATPPPPSTGHPVTQESPPPPPTPLCPSCWGTLDWRTPWRSAFSRGASTSWASRTQWCQKERRE